MTQPQTDDVPFDLEGTSHDCVAESLTFAQLRPDLEREPLLNPDRAFFCGWVKSQV